MLAGDPAFVCNESKLVVLQVSIAIKKERKRMTYAGVLIADIKRHFYNKHFLS